MGSFRTEHVHMLFSCAAVDEADELAQADAAPSTCPTPRATHPFPHQQHSACRFRRDAHCTLSASNVPFIHVSVLQHAEGLRDIIIIDAFSVPGTTYSAIILVLKYSLEPLPRLGEAAQWQAAEHVLLPYDCESDYGMRCKVKGGCFAL